MDFTGEISIESYLSTGVSDACGAATGVLTGSNIEWDPCRFGDKHGTNEWSPMKAQRVQVACRTTRLKG